MFFNIATCYMTMMIIVSLLVITSVFVMVITLVFPIGIIIECDMGNKN
jgi:hypothetical protein